MKGLLHGSESLRGLINASWTQKSCGKDKENAERDAVSVMSDFLIPRIKLPVPLFKTVVKRKRQDLEVPVILATYESFRMCFIFIDNKDISSILNLFKAVSIIM